MVAANYFITLCDQESLVFFFCSCEHINISTRFMPSFTHPLPINYWLLLSMYLFNFFLFHIKKLLSVCKICHSDDFICKGHN